jgi:hypothetical protein
VREEDGTYTLTGRCIPFVACNERDLSLEKNNGCGEYCVYFKNVTDGSEGCYDDCSSFLNYEVVKKNELKYCKAKECNDRLGMTLEVEGGDEMKTCELPEDHENDNDNNNNNPNTNTNIKTNNYLYNNEDDRIKCYYKRCEDNINNNNNNNNNNGNNGNSNRNSNNDDDGCTQECFSTCPDGYWNAINHNVYTCELCSFFKEADDCVDNGKNCFWNGGTASTSVSGTYCKDKSIWYKCSDLSHEMCNTYHLDNLIIVIDGP